MNAAASERQDFDRVVDRRATASVKWDRYRDRDVLPLWVADMDFAAPSAVIEALAHRVEHGVFGYSHGESSLADAVIDHLGRCHAWEVERSWLTWLPGTVAALNCACRLIESNVKVVSTKPIYPPFLAAPKNMDRELISVPLLIDSGGRQTLDLDGLGRAFAAGGRLLLFCNPYNPGGRVFYREELEALAEQVLRYDVLVVADELHADLVLEPSRRHLPFAALSPAVAKRVITLQGPSKTFNIAGLGICYAVIADTELRRRFRAASAGILPYVNALAYVAAEAAYRHGGKWRAALIDYLRANRALVTSALAAWPGVSASLPEATFLYWIDARAMGVENPAKHFERHGVGLSDGEEFGAPGFVRLNFGCPRATLKAALARMTSALDV